MENYPVDDTAGSNQTLMILLFAWTSYLLLGNRVA